MIPRRTHASSMKRTRSAAKNKTEDNDGDTDDLSTTWKSKDLQANKEETTGSKNAYSTQQKAINKINLKNLKDFSPGKEKASQEPKVDVPKKNKIRAVVDLEMMKNELRQLEDPPVTSEEKQSCSARLPYTFFDAPCEKLAQDLLGKILVRRLENGTILKGIIVETEGYLGTIDKASHSYQNKVTPRNMPMFMPPGTIYVYMTYGMYHCFNISSQEKEAYVLIRAVEPLIGLNYMELLRNMQLKNNKKQKEIVQDVKKLKFHELCNSPSNICSAFAIDDDVLCGENISISKSLWIENDVNAKMISIVAAPSTGSGKSFITECKTLLRFYILGNPCVSYRNVQYEKKAFTIKNT